MIQVTAERLRELLLAEAFVLSLESGGVDNWEWYGDSLDDYRAFEERLDYTLDEDLHKFL